MQTELKTRLSIALKGGPGSGNHGHVGIPGHRGGSASVVTPAIPPVPVFDDQYADITFDRAFAKRAGIRIPKYIHKADIRAYLLSALYVKESMRSGKDAVPPPSEEIKRFMASYPFLFEMENRVDFGFIIGGKVSAQAQADHLGSSLRYSDEQLARADAIRKDILKQLDQMRFSEREAQATMRKLDAESALSSIYSGAPVTKAEIEARKNALAQSQAALQQLYIDRAKVVGDAILQGTPPLPPRKAKVLMNRKAAEVTAVHSNGRVVQDSLQGVFEMTRQIASNQVGTDKKPIRFNVTKIRDGRSYHQGGQIYMDERAISDWRPYSILDTVYHEYGHVLEYSVPGLSDKIQAFYNRRTKDYPLVSLRSMGYSRGEKARLDKFLDPYMGKVYSRGRSTEILSMGLGWLTSRTVDFLRGDPDYANHLILWLRGE